MVLSFIIIELLLESKSYIMDKVMWYARICDKRLRHQNPLGVPGTCVVEISVNIPDIVKFS